MSTASQADLAARIGVSPPRLSQILNHPGELVTVDIAARLEEALDVKPGTHFTVDTEVDLRPYLNFHRGAA
jgi:plasmid maintenance system antidote protein VapI